MPSRIVRQEIPMAESVGSYINDSCRLVPGALVALSTFRNKVRDHAKSNLERRYRWRRDFAGFPADVRVTRRTVCKTCQCLRPTKEKCGDHYDPIKGVQKVSYVCGVVIPDETPIRDQEESEDGADAQPAANGSDADPVPVLKIELKKAEPVAIEATQAS
jgi:hypothetical protein